VKLKKCQQITAVADDFCPGERIKMRKKIWIIVLGIVLAVTLGTWAAINWLSAGAGSGCSV